MKLTPERLIRAYSAGAFPMAEARSSAEVAFYQPVKRGVFDLRHIHIPRRLRRWMARTPHRYRIDCDFAQVIAHCAQAPRSQTQGTWINGEIERAFCELHQCGLAHCLSAHGPSGELLGGVYGLHLGQIFFGESMFAKATNASKGCLIALFACLAAAGFRWIDAQLPNRHLAQFGLQTWANEDFLAQLPGLLDGPALAFPRRVTRQQISQFLEGQFLEGQFLQSTTHTS